MVVCNVGRTIRIMAMDQAAEFWAKARVQGVVAKFADELWVRDGLLQLLVSPKVEHEQWMTELGLADGQQTAPDLSGAAWKVWMGVGGSWTTARRFWPEVAKLSVDRVNGGFPDLFPDCATREDALEWCPCGIGRGDRRHVHLACTLGGVTAARARAAAVVEEHLLSLMPYGDWRSAVASGILETSHGGGVVAGSQHVCTLLGFLSPSPRDPLGRAGSERSCELAYRGLLRKKFCWTVMHKLRADGPWVDGLALRLIGGAMHVRAVFMSELEAMVAEFRFSEQCNEGLARVPGTLKSGRCIPEEGTTCEGPGCVWAASMGGAPKLANGYPGRPTVLDVHRA